MKALELEGSMVALATPFKSGMRASQADEQAPIDEEAYARLIAFQLKEGTRALIPIGTTGEAATLSADERYWAVKCAVRAAGGKVPVIAGAGSFSTQDTIAQVGRAREAGADAALVVTPYYSKPTQGGLVAHYQAVASAHPGFPLVAYNVPSRTGGDLIAETLLRLCDIAEVIAVKEATASMVRALEIRERCGDRMVLLSGDDFTVLPLLACGGRGVISVSANVVPRAMAALVDAGLKGDLARAQELQLKLNPLHRLLFAEPNPIPVKWALHRMGLMEAGLRLPLTPLSAEISKDLEAELIRLGVVR